MAAAPVWSRSGTTSFSWTPSPSPPTVISSERGIFDASSRASRSLTVTPELGGHLGHLRRLAALLGEALARAPVLSELRLHVHRQPDEARLVGEGPLDGLPDPPGGVRGEPGAAIPAELLDGADQPDVALGDEIAQRQPAVLVAAGEHHHQAEVRLHHPLLRRLAPGGHLLRELDLLLAREKRDLADLAQVHLDRRAVAEALRLFLRRAPRPAGTRGPARRRSAPRRPARPRRRGSGGASGRSRRSGSSSAGGDGSRPAVMASRWDSWDP